MKFKVGDKVKFIGKTTDHQSCGNDLEADIKKYNNIFTIAYVSKSYIEFEENRCWYIKEYEIELVQEKQFHFEKETMYKGMEDDKEYALKELKL